MSPTAHNGDRHVVFVGVDSRSSRALTAVPRWSRRLGEPLALRPVDLPLAANRERYLRIFDGLQTDPNIAGAVITEHKVAMYEAIAGRCTYVSPDARRLRECAVLAARPSGVAAFATDVRAIGAEVDRIWPSSRAPVVCLGGGGAAAALCLQLLRRRPAPDRILVCEHDRARGRELGMLFTRETLPHGVKLHVEVGAMEWDDAVVSLPPGALVVNATGLGKTDRSSPLSPAAVFPERVTVWDLNYRGPLPFLAQAHAQAQLCSLNVHDGWHLFALGWLAALSALLDVDVTTDIEESFVAIAEEVGR